MLNTILRFHQRLYIGQCEVLSKSVKKWVSNCSLKNAITFSIRKETSKNTLCNILEYKSDKY